MCTAVAYRKNGLFFGRNLDYEKSYGESIAFSPRGYDFAFGGGFKSTGHYAIIGTAHISGGYPLYYDGMNEKGLCIAGLNFLKGAEYAHHSALATAPFEIIPLVLSLCKSTEEACKLLDGLATAEIPFGASLPAARLHWLIADKEKTVAAEPKNGKIKIYDAPVGVLTNDPDFPEQMRMLGNYAALSPQPPENRFLPDIKLTPYSRGLGAYGLPGDLSSASRFARAAFMLANSVCENGDELLQLFHILDTVKQVNGCCVTENGGLEKTIYTACFDTERLLYCYTAYSKRQITAVDMRAEDRSGAALKVFPMLLKNKTEMQNGLDFTAVKC